MAREKAREVYREREKIVGGKKDSLTFDPPVEKRLFLEQRSTLLSFSS